MERVEILNSFKNQQKGLHSHLLLTIFLYNTWVLRKGTSFGEIFYLVVYNRFEHRITRKRSLPAATSHISPASVMLECSQNLSKLTNQRVYQILVYWNNLQVSLPTGVLSLTLAALFYFLHALFSALRPDYLNACGRGQVTWRRS